MFPELEEVPKEAGSQRQEGSILFVKERGVGGLVGFCSERLNPKPHMD